MKKQKIKFDLESFALDDVLKQVKARHKHQKEQKNLNKKKSK